MSRLSLRGSAQFTALASLPSLLAVVTVAAPLVLAPSTAFADPNGICIPNFNPLPNAIPDGNTPNWWGSADPRFETQRWNGASERTFTNGTTDSAWVKTAWDAGSNSLYVHYHVDFDLGADPDLDHIVLALAPTASSDRLLIDVDPLSAAGCSTSECSNVDATSAVQYALQPSGGGAAGAFATTAPTGWFAVEYPRVWLTKTPLGSSSFAYEWDLKFRVRLPGALAGGGKLYTAMLVGLESGSSGYNVVSMNWPRAAGSSGNNAMTSVDPSAASIAAGIAAVSFGDLTFSNRCTDGVFIAAGDLGSTFGATLPTLSNKINLNAGGTTTFVVRPTNDTGATLAANSIQADFYLANWGINGDAGLWSKINRAPIELSGDVPNGAKADGEAGRGSMTFNWTIPAEQESLYAANAHQCIQAVLSSTGAPLDVASNGFWQNMDFRTASVIREEATVDVAGLGAPPAGHEKHRIWLYVDTERMPSPAACEAAASKQGGGDVKKGKSKQGLTPALPPEGCDNGAGARYKLLDPATAQKVTAQQAEAYAALLDKLAKTKQPAARNKLLLAAGIHPGDRDITAEDMRVGDLEGATSAEQLPQLVVRAYRETGEKVGLDGKLHPLIIPMSSYGYYVEHTGELRGWEVALHGAKKMGEHVYLIELGEGEIGTISTTIRAIDDKTKPCAEDAAGEGCDEAALPAARRHPRLEEKQPTPQPNPGPEPLPENDKCNCSATPTPAGGVVSFGVALLVALGLRRRRRSSR
jgi:MYXO-CTERM domain-containing protein